MFKRKWDDSRFGQRHILAMVAVTMLVAGGCSAPDDVAGQDTAGDDPAADGRTSTPQINTTPEQDALRSLIEASSIPVEVHAAGGIPRVVSLSVGLRTDLPNDPVVRVADFLDTYRDFFHLTDPANQLFLERFREDIDGQNEQHFFFHQKHNDIPVYGAALAVHVHEGRVTMTNGHYLPTLPALAAPTIDSTAAEQIALNSQRGLNLLVLGSAQLTYFDKSLLDERFESDTHLAWQVRVDGVRSSSGFATVRKMFVDAISGDILFSLDETHEDGADKDFLIQTVNYTTSSSCWAAPWETADDDWFDEDGSVGYPGTAADAGADGQDAFNYTHAVYDYFFDNFHRHSWDDDEEEVWVMVHVGDADFGGWAAYSSAGCIRFKDNGITLDIMGHEWSHAIDDEEGELEYVFQSGAIDESFADFFGCMVDGNWLIGEDTPGGAFRDLSNPPAFGDPDHWNDFVDKDEDDDNGGVHTNSGIPNKAAFLITDGGLHNDLLINGLGRTKAQRLYYSVLVGGVTSNTSFNDLRNLMVGRATYYYSLNQYGFIAQDVCDISNAFAAVGIKASAADSDCDGTPNNQDPDNDGDGVNDGSDNCPNIPNSAQADKDGNGVGDACDDDIDGDGTTNDQDNCLYTSNPDQNDADGDGRGDLCDDQDVDGILDIADNCPLTPNHTQTDTDGDGAGDACDNDDDNDGILDDDDNCPLNANSGQQDAENDGVGDSCDNCPDVRNADQEDCDQDGIGRACDDPELAFPRDGCRWYFEEFARWVHPLDEVSIGPCRDCPRWIPRDFEILINVALPDAYAVQVVDELGQVVKTSAPSREHDISFHPSPSYHFTFPGSGVTPYQGKEYFIRVLAEDATAEILTRVGVETSMSGR